jgi:hypothetical protein
MKHQHSAATQPPQQGLQDSEKRGVFFKEYAGLLR